MNPRKQETPFYLRFSFLSIVLLCIVQLVMIIELHSEQYKPVVPNEVIISAPKDLQNTHTVYVVYDPDKDSMKIVIEPKGKNHGVNGNIIHGDMYRDSSRLVYGFIEPIPVARAARLHT